MMQSIVHFLRELEYKLQNHVVPLFMILDNEYLMDSEIKTKQLWEAHSHKSMMQNLFYILFHWRKRDQCYVRWIKPYQTWYIFVCIMPQIVSDVIITGWDTNMKT